DAQVRISVVQCMSHLGVREYYIPVKIVGLPIPGRILKYDVPQGGIKNREDSEIWIRTANPTGPLRLAAESIARIDPFARARIPRTRIKLLDPLQLRGREAIRRIRAGAQQTGHIELAATGVFDQTVSGAVQFVASGDHGLPDGRRERIRHNAGRFPV